MSVHLQQFFQLCNPDNTENVDREAFRGLCDRFQISAKDADSIFDDLDHDQDGLISFEDFSRGFSDFINHQDPDIEDGIAKELGEQMEDGIANDKELTKHHAWATLTSEVEHVGKADSNETQLQWLIDELQTTDKQYLVSCLETAVEDLLKNMKKLQEDKTQLEEMWKREKQEHLRHMKRMEEEMDSQVKETEMKIRKKAQDEMESERKSLQTKMDHESDNLQAYLKLIEKVNTWMESQPPDTYDVRLDEVKCKLDDAVHENRQLRMSLLDTQTSIALMRNELIQLRTLYEEKCRELSSEREKVLEVLHEQDHLSRQLNLLHDVNRRLQDTNDALRNSLERPYPPSSKRDSVVCRAKSGSVLGDYFDAAVSMNSTIDRYTDSEEEDADDERNDETIVPLRHARSMDVNFPYCKKAKHSDKRHVRRLMNNSDSGVSTAQEQEDSSTPDSSLIVKETDKLANLLTTESNAECNRPTSLPSVCSSHIDDERKITQVNGIVREQLSLESDTVIKSSNSSSHLDDLPRRKITDIIKQLGIQDEPVRSRSLNARKSSSTSQASVTSEAKSKLASSPCPQPRKSLQTKLYSNKELHQENHPVQNGIVYKRTVRKSSSTSSNFSIGSTDGNSVANGSVIIEDSEDPFEPNGPPEQTYKVILVGDAGVGKSSFALRINKGVFVRHTSSTLSVDFLMRTIKVDGRNVAVQLWDTAGQERFRSITKSYFRNADGVMLMYDCTCEHSFLSVRQWVDDVNVSCFYRMAAKQANNKGLTNQRIPLMIVANKIDLRETLKKSGKRCISTCEGERIAETCDSTFIETSAKDGDNVLLALANLVRSMSNHKELQTTASTMQLCEVKPKKSSCCSR